MSEGTDTANYILDEQVKETRKRKKREIEGERGVTKQKAKGFHSILFNTFVSTK